MSAEFICDGCGRRAPGLFFSTNPTRHFEPKDWFQRGDGDGIQDACSRECIKKIAERTGKSRVVMPSFGK